MPIQPRSLPAQAGGRELMSFVHAASRCLSRRCLMGSTVSLIAQNVSAAGLSCRPARRGAVPAITPPLSSQLCTHVYSIYTPAHSYNVSAISIVIYTAPSPHPQIALHILACLHPRDLSAAAAVSRAWRALAQRDECVA